MRLFQIHGNFSRAKVESENAFYIRHPMAPSVKIYWLFDAPHLLKFTRNQILKDKEVQRMYNLEKKNHSRRAFKLTESHINPTNFEKMNVGKAAQLLSDSVAHALLCYRRNKKIAYLFKGSETTERFTKLINDVFDVMNGRCISQGINVGNWWKKKEKLDVFINILDITEECNRSRKPNDPDTPVKMFLSNTTLQACRVPVLSVIALTEEMFNVGYTSVLPGKLNQDPLERFFGIVRSIDDTPTAQSWLQLFRILSLYNPTKMHVERGNVDKSENPVSYEECLLNKFKSCEKEAT
uniref:Transposable element P transposase-like GTP-binding insertion domain-containing protein n=1 Tax=Daphnia galeata TaxID=27404 RepID=A0A8J2RV83_9CRUS|nr:unnamed protein product [Daphnia galeata]